MQHIVVILLLLLSRLGLITAGGCSLHLRNTSAMPAEMKTMIFESVDPNSSLSRAVRNQLCLNGIELVEQQGSSLRPDVPSLRMLTSSIIQDTASIILQNGRTAEYQMVLSVSAVFMVPSKESYPISTKVYRSFFNNQWPALAKDAEQQILIKEMYDKAAEQLLHQLRSIKYTKKKDVVTTQAPDSTASSRVSTTLGN